MNSNEFDYKPSILTCMAYNEYKSSINGLSKTNNRRKYFTNLHQSDRNNFEKLGYKLEYFDLVKGQKYSSVGGILAYHLNDNGMKSIYISFRGTVDSPDWKTNINIFTTDLSFKGGRTLNVGTNNAVHRGFKEAYDSSFSKIFGSLRSIIHKPDIIIPEEKRKFKVTVAGHSLGGALANVCFMQLLTIPELVNDDDCALLKLETYGAPRLFTQKAVFHIEKNYLSKEHIQVKRYVNRNNSRNPLKNKDVVTSIGGKLIHDLQHLGKECTLDTNKIPQQFVFIGPTPHKMDGYFFGLHNLYK